MSTVYLLKYNNYYNRIVAREKNLEGYLLQEYLLDRKDDVNFVEDDGVDTTYVCNTETTPDYMVVANGNVIESRWFVIERKILRKGQYKFTLHRDLLVDYYNAIVNAQCFIEKATVLASDPFIFNQEDMTFNQIKTSETLLKDETGCAWVVGYIPKDAFPEGGTVTGDAILDDSADITVEGIENWEYYQYQTTDFVGQVTEHKTTGRVKVTLQNEYVDDIIYNKPFGIDSHGILSIDVGPSNQDPGLNCTVGVDDGNKLIEAIQNECPKEWNTAGGKVVIATRLREYKGGHSVIDTLNFKSLNGQILYDSTTKLYSRIIVETSQKSESVDITSSTIPALYQYLDENLTRTVSSQGSSFTISGTANQNTYKSEFTYSTYRIKIEQIPQQVTATISKPEARYHLEDQPYDMFAMPYSDDLAIYKNGAKLFNANKSIAVNIATQIAAATGSANVYDVQLLPYCPVRYCILDDGTFDVKSAKVDYVQDRNKNNIGIILWATTSSFTLNINKEILSTNPKIENLVDRWRLCSPSFNGQFEFSVAMNGGVDYFNVDCNYKPFNPYIHVNPNFKRMYGQDFNDARGLICGGDFSLPQLSNAWANYQLSNKNYQNIFDRQIVNLEVNNKIQRTREITSAALGTMQGALTGAITGGMAGGVGGAIVGGILGAGASAAAGVADVKLADQLRAETIDYTRDMYGYNLGNIQAMPTSIAKTSAFTFNNKLFPVLEYYTCSAEEKAALINKCKWNGMTVMRIDTIGAFIGNQTDQYIKARLIRIIDKSLDDYHMVKAIDDELNRGAFF